MNRLPSVEALKFLTSCNYKDKNHTERMGLIDLARELYPDTQQDTTQDTPVCMFNTDNTGCYGVEENKCANYKCADCYWF